MNATPIAAVQARITEITARFQAGPAFAETLRQATSRVPAADGSHDAGAPVSPTTAAPTAGLSEIADRLPAAARPWLGQIEQAANRHGLDPRLLVALVAQESGFRPDARSSAGALGLTQLMPATARELGVDPHDPEANLDGGARYLRRQLDRFGSVPLALAAYNAGPGRVAAAGGIPDITQTQRYVASVTALYARLGGTR